MKEYRFSKLYYWISYGSLILGVGLLLFSFVNWWMEGLLYLFSSITFWIFMGIYFVYRNGTGILRYDQIGVEIKSDVVGGSSIKTDWSGLEDIKIASGFRNIILNFGKAGKVSFEIDRFEFKLFILEMLKSLLEKEINSTIHEKISFLKDIDPETAIEEEKINKKNGICTFI